jgi:hypothetical protein
MLPNKKIPVCYVTYYWDNGEWYAIAYDKDYGFVCDSQKIWFPVELSHYGIDEVEDVSALLQNAFPEAEIKHL